MGLLTSAPLSWFDDGCCDIKYLDLWQDAPVTGLVEPLPDAGWDLDRHHVTIASPGSDEQFQCAAELLWHYRFYPPDLLNHVADFDLEDRSMQVGDRIVQRINLLRLGKWPVLDVVGITEVTQVLDEPRRAGFTYATVEPHVAQGRWSVLVAWWESGELTLTIESVSRPAAREPGRNRPLIRSFQKVAHRRGIEHFKQLVTS